MQGEKVWTKFVISKLYGELGNIKFIKNTANFRTEVIFLGFVLFYIFFSS